MALTGRTLSKPTSTKPNPMKSIKSLTQTGMTIGLCLFLLVVATIIEIAIIVAGIKMYHHLNQPEQANVCKCAEGRK
jgi:hypothetical protein